MNEQDPRIKQDIILLIVQYLQNEGYTISKTVLQDEANIKIQEHFREFSLVKKLRGSILEWVYDDILSLSKDLFTQFSGISLAAQSGFLYSVHKQHFLELINKREYQQAFTHLTKRIKPFEKFAPAEEMIDLCYLVTCQSVQDVKSFKSWEQRDGRYKVVQLLESLIDLQPPSADHSVKVPPNRLVELLKQAVARQMEASPPHMSTKVDTLMKDYKATVMPNRPHAVMKDALSGVKSLDYSLEGDVLSIIAGSSDGVVRQWNADTQTLVKKMHGHGGRVWQVSCSQQDDLCCSASADSTVKVWSTLIEGKECMQTLRGHEYDIYSVHFHSRSKHILSGGYDKTLRLFDVKTGAQVRCFKGHLLPVSQAIFNDIGNMALSGSKDGTVKLWDVASGLSVKSFSVSSEVISVDFSECGDQILIGARCNTIYLYDLRRGDVEKRFRGHQNTSKHFIRSKFGPSSTVVSGSEDGFLYMWDVKTGEIFQTLEGHENVVYDAIWCPTRSTLFSCSEDATVRSFVYDPSVAAKDPSS